MKTRQWTSPGARFLTAVSTVNQNARLHSRTSHTRRKAKGGGHFLQVYRKLATSITFIARARVVELVSIRTEVAASSPLRWRIVGKRPERAWTFSSRALSGEAPRVLSSQLSDGETDGDLGDHVKRMERRGSMKRFGSAWNAGSPLACHGPSNVSVIDEGCSPSVRVPAEVSGQGTVAVGSPASRNTLAKSSPKVFKKRKRPPALSISNGESNIRRRDSIFNESLVPELTHPSHDHFPHHEFTDMRTHVSGMQMQLATERELEDASLAEEVTVVQGRTFALSSKRGKRRFSCEDAYQAAPGLDGDPTRGIFSVFDGHGGREAADYAADNLHDNILREINRVESSLDLDEFTEQVKAAMIEGFLATDQEFLSLGDLQGGATATTAYLSKGRIWVANVGDCRAVICQGGEAVALTHDHRPDCAKEREAVERRGGEIVRERVQGVLGVSRALGDRELKSYITAEPSVFCGPVSESSEFLILGTDGLWDHVDNQEAVELVRLALDEKRGIHAACRGLVELARANRSRDDISVLVVELRSYQASSGLI